jgi:hypothetical protein
LSQAPVSETTSADFRTRPSKADRRSSVFGNVSSAGGNSASHPGKRCSIPGNGSTKLENRPSNPGGHSSEFDSGSSIVGNLSSNPGNGSSYIIKFSKIAICCASAVHRSKSPTGYARRHEAGDESVVADSNPETECEERLAKVRGVSDCHEL